MKLADFEIDDLRRLRHLQPEIPLEDLAAQFGLTEDQARALLEGS